MTIFMGKPNSGDLYFYFKLIKGANGWKSMNDFVCNLGKKMMRN
jgi:hypothetical protein